MSEKSLIREPFVHFAVLGALLFGLWGLVGEDEGVEAVPAQGGELSEGESVAPQTVSIKAEEVDMLALSFTERNDRDPEPEELEALLAARVEEELLYLEGMSNGLNLGDPVVRRRVVQKQRFLLEELNPAAEPTPDEITAHLDAHPDRYRKSQAVAFSQHFFDKERRTNPQEDARRALVVVDTTDDDPGGDPFPLGDDFGLRSLDSHRAELGPAIATVLADAPVGKWSLTSSRWGWHLVRVSERADAASLTEDSVREQARYDLLQERRAAAVSKALEELRVRYDVQVEGR